MQDDLQQLFYTATELTAMAEAAQDVNQDEDWRKLQFAAVRKSYLDWYRKCLMLLSSRADMIEAKHRFIRLYEGKWYKFGIEGFLRLGYKQHSLNGWVARFDSAFEQKIIEQCNILAAEVTEWNTN